ncbi:hypothetical protein C9994_02070 [Marivirga lumbricoides]|uniref:Uncharacterized protein n=1 Tax=Marivirga lumbricoides TaxID=1046115 RepID=A0A2T4DUY8_9BACT|nr:hypothetical protein C9994_02070 [Marivirga lumbricoides]
MEKYELRFTKDDLAKIKSKRNKSNIAFFIAFILLGVIVYFMESTTPIFLKIIAYFFFAITVYIVFNIIFGDNSKKDLKNQIKIATKVKVAQKRTESDSGGTTYIIEFEGNEDIKEYYVKYKVYEKIKIGDIIELEYSKNSLWILKVLWNNIDIENKNYVK